MAEASETRKEHFATERAPFHFVDSGLPNIYLVGIRYFVYKSGRVVAEIPAIKQLMQLIARHLIAKPGPLTGDEIRFLRKRLGEKQVNFSHAVGLEPETLSRAENGHQTLSESNDKLIRLYYALSAFDDDRLNEARESLRKAINEWKQANQGRLPKKTVVKVTNDEWELQAA